MAPKTKKGLKGVFSCCLTGSSESFRKKQGMGLGKKVLLIGPRIRKCTAGVAGGEGAQAPLMTSLVTSWGMQRHYLRSLSNWHHVLEITQVELRRSLLPGLEKSPSGKTTPSAPWQAWQELMPRFPTSQKQTRRPCSRP
uniref:Fas binding factor 1 n=1 Tax=Rousettus aegyptiacus TaxID=9407 RepID=A0A7J8G7R7_ROUAE|nr:Fas binding factor 1 [Rousettus aegyptiacus]